MAAAARVVAAVRAEAGALEDPREDCEAESWEAADREATARAEVVPMVEVVRAAAAGTAAVRGSVAKAMASGAVANAMETVRIE